jgi:hypothetical protein
VTLEGFQNAKKKQAADAPLSETERLLKETALLERDTNVRSTAMNVIPFGISQNVRDKLALLKDGKFDYIAMVCGQRCGGSKVPVLRLTWLSAGKETQYGPRKRRRGQEPRVDRAERDPGRDRPQAPKLRGVPQSRVTDRRGRIHGRRLLAA